MTDLILQPLTADQKKIVRREVLRFNHRLDETGLFSDQALASLLDEHPRDLVTILTRRPGAPASEPWIAGEAAGLSGEALVNAARAGALSIRIRGAMTQSPRYQAVFDRLMAEFSQATGLRRLEADATVVISGPRAGNDFGMAMTEAMLWNVRGQRTIHVYPPREDLIPATAIEGRLLGEVAPALAWTPALEDHGLPVMLRPGQTAFWPLHSPYRVVDGDGLNVSVAIEFASLASRLANSVFSGNGRLRRSLGRAPDSRGPARFLSPLYRLAELALMAGTPPTTAAGSVPAPRFDVDPSADGGIRWREGQAPDWASPAKAARPARKAPRRKAESLKAA